MENLLRMGKHMNKLHELMVITMEECGELVQSCSKSIRREEYVNDKLVEEVGDVYCMIELMIENELITWDQLLERADVKRNKLKKWSKLIDEESEVRRLSYHPNRRGY